MGEFRHCRARGHENVSYQRSRGRRRTEQKLVQVLISKLRELWTVSEMNTTLASTYLADMVCFLFAKKYTRDPSSLENI